MENKSRNIFPVSGKIYLLRIRWKITGRQEKRGSIFLSVNGLKNHTEWDILDSGFFNRTRSMPICLAEDNFYTK
jgi:hypothetical protein